MNLLPTSVVLALAATALAQGSYVYPPNILAATGGPCAAVPGATYQSVDTPYIDLQGNATWRASLTVDANAGITLANSYLIAHGRTGADQKVLIRRGVAEPTGTLPGVTIQDVGQANALLPMGTPICTGRLQGQGIVNTGSVASGRNDSAIFLGLPGSQTILQRYGQPAPGLPGFFVNQALDALSGDAFCGNAAGELVFFSRVCDSADAQQKYVLYKGTQNALAPIVVGGEVWPNSGNATVGLPVSSATIDNQGRVLFQVSLTIGSGTTPVTANDDRLIGCYVPGQGNRTIAREGDPAPGTIGAQFDSFTLLHQGLTASGDLLFSANLRGGDTVLANSTALYLTRIGSSQPPTMVLRQGTVLADGTTLSVILLQGAALRSNGELAITVYRNVTPNNAPYMLLRGTVGNLQIAFRQAEALPPNAGEYFGTFNYTPWFTGDKLLWQVRVQNSTGQLIGYVLRDLLAASPTDLASFHDTYALPGGTVSATEFRMVTTPSGDGGPRGYSQNGEWVSEIRTATSSAIVRGMHGSLVASPASLPTTGGTQTLDFHASPSLAGNFYLMLGSLSGTRPPYPYGGLSIPLNFDFWTPLSQQNANGAVYQNSMGQLDGTGSGHAAFAFPANAPFMVGAIFHHAVVVLNTTSPDLVWSTQPASVHIY